MFEKGRKRKKILLLAPASQWGLRDRSRGITGEKDYSGPQYIIQIVRSGVALGDQWCVLPVWVPNPILTTPNSEEPPGDGGETFSCLPTA